MTPALARGTAVAAALAAGVLLVAGCTSDDSDPSSGETTAGVTSIGSVAAYCEIQGLRQMIADGQIQISQLPDFADLTEVDGTPLILDFKKPVAEGSAAFADRLFSSPGLSDVDVDRVKRSECVDTTTDADIEKSQGGPGYLAKSPG